MKANDLKEMGKLAKQAAFAMAKASTTQKNQALEALRNQILQSQEIILEANEQDQRSARQSGLSEALIDRLSLKGRLAALAADMQQVAGLPDPVGEEFEKTILPNGLQVCKRRTPIGVLGVIYESRPNVTLDVAALAIKSGNCAILRGGSEALLTNQVLLSLIQHSLQQANLPLNAIQMIKTSDRAHITELLHLHESVDLIIPRGGAQLHQYCRENSTIPVMTGGIGICHLFVDQSADQEKALEVIFNAKTQRPTVCNALDTLLVHKKVASEFIPKVIQNLHKAHVEFRVDDKTHQLLINHDLSDVSIRLAREGDWDTEWLSLILGIRIVPDLAAAIDHIRTHSSGHSDGILTQQPEHAKQFVQEIDSAAVYVNASTRFTDGSQLGLGAEVAISTQKLHARGPVGLKELTTYKWIIHGDYHVRP